MKLLRPLAILVFLILLISLAGLWWNQPAKSDMANYAPADSLVYIEMDSLPDVVMAFQSTDVWKAVSATVGTSNKPQSRWALLAAKSGVGPTDLVLTSRAQFALVVVGVNTAEKEDQLRVKPEVALIVETHTSKWRMKSTAISNIKRLADFAYGSSVCTERTADADYIECVEKQGSRKIVGAIDGSVVTIANSDDAIKKCLEVRRGQRPSLHTDAELLRLRTSLKSNTALAFGYVSQLNAARLVSQAGPLLLGKAPGDHQLEQLLSNSAAKILRNVAWVSTPSAGGIEDHYQIAVDPDVAKRLEPAFDTTTGSEDFWKFVPEAFRSVTIYRSKDPLAAWSSLDSAVAIKLDTVSSVIFAALLKASLSGYGIEEPRSVIGALSSPVITLRPALGQGSLLLARVGNNAELRRALATSFQESGKGQILEDIKIDPVKEKEVTALLMDGYVLMGKTEDVGVYLAQVRNKELISADRLQTLKLSNRRTDSAIITYTNERNSFASIIRSMGLLNNRTFTEKELTTISNSLTKLEFSWTESSMDSNGIERRTQSAFGQFGNLLSFAQADSSSTRP